MFLKFHFVNTDGCTGTFAIAIFNGQNALVDNSTIEILYDDFKSDIAVSLETFTDSPPGAICRRWASGDSELIIKIPEHSISKIGISTWANTVYPHEKVIIYGSKNYKEWTEICTIECDSRILGCYKMSYEIAKYSVKNTNVERFNSNLYKDSYLQETFDFNKLLEV